MSDADWFEDDYEIKVDLRLWRKLLAYTLHYRGTAIAFAFVALGFAGSDLCFPILTGRVIADVQEHGRDVRLGPYAWMYAGLTVVLCSCIWGFIACAGKIRTHVSHDIRRDAFEQLQQLSFSFYDTKSVGWLMARLTSDCQRLSNILAWGVMDFFWGTVLMIGVSVGDVYFELAAGAGGARGAARAVWRELVFSAEDFADVADRAEDEFADHGGVQRRDRRREDVEGVCARGGEPARLRYVDR